MCGHSMVAVMESHGYFALVGGSGNAEVLSSDITVGGEHEAAMQARMHSIEPKKTRCRTTNPCISTNNTSTNGTYPMYLPHVPTQCTYPMYQPHVPTPCTNLRGGLRGGSQMDFTGIYNVLASGPPP